MLTDDEKKFVEYWEQNGDKQNTLLWWLLSGLPAGLVFALPILVAVIFHDWYKNMVYISNTQLMLITICVLCIAVFFAIFRGKFRWEHNDQLYKELKFKQERNDAANKTS
jgi:glucan phosphoethanolaminetransferase (alkaline phosphatase superfamily)